MLDINLLTPTANSYMSQFDTIDKQASMETVLIAINECIGSLERLKDVLKSSDKISIGNTLSLSLSISNETRSIEETICHLKNPKQI